MAQRLHKKAAIYIALKKQILDESLPKGAKLPSAKELAEIYSVSRGTVFKAIDQLENDGSVVRKKRCGIFVKGDEDPCLVDHVPRIAAKRKREIEIMESIMSDIRQGQLRVGSALPSRKTLLFQYSASSKTIRKTLEHCLRKGLLFKKGGSIFVGPTPSAGIASGKSVQFFGGSPLLRGLIHQRPRENFLMALESECGIWGVSTTQMKDEGREPSFFGVPRRGKEGVLRTVMTLDSPSMGKLIEAGAPFRGEKRSRNMLPLVVFASDSTVFKSKAFRCKPFDPLYIFAWDDHAAGKSVADYLSSLGHQKISYFHHTPAVWNLRRFDGLNERLRALFGASARTSRFQADMGEGPVHRAKLLSVKETVKTMESAVCHMFENYRFTHLTPFRRLAAESLSAVNMDEQTRVMEAIFDRALRTEKSTAWVCSDPTATLMASDFLQRRGVRIPRDLSLIGFANQDLRVAIRGINMYDFQVERMGYLAAHCLLGDIPIKKSKQGVVECPGRVVERGSVARNARMVM